MSLETIQNITLDFTIPKIKNVRCIEDDKNSRIVNITVTNNGERYLLDKENMIARYKILKPDHTYIYNEVPINDDGTVTIELTEQALASVGVAHSELQISDSHSGKILSTMPFHIIVEKSVVGNRDIESANESDVINGMINHLADYHNPHKIPVADSSTPGLVKSGTDITVDNSGNVSVNDNSHNHTVNNISDLTATAGELNVLDGITANTTELNYTNGVTSNIQTQLNRKVDSSLKGSANGLAELDVHGKVLSSQLPSFVDDVIEGYFYDGKFYENSAYTTEITGETGKIYIDLSTNKTYRWSGSTFVVISETLALGETSSTACRGDKGKIAYEHAQSAHAPVNAQENVIESVKVNGTALIPSLKAVDISVPTKTSQLTNDSGYKTTDTNTWRGIQDNLTSTSTTDSLSANQGKILKGLVDGKASASHTHNYAGSSSVGGDANNALKLSGYSLSLPGTNDVWGTIPLIGGSDGVMEIGKYIDFHIADGSTVDYDVRITAESSGLTISGTTKGTFSGSLSGTATTISQKVDASAVTHTNYNTNGTYVPTMNFLSYWNGAYNSGGSSNLAYCKHGAFGSIVTKSISDYATASHTHSYLPLSGGTLTGSLTVPSIIRCRNAGTSGGIELAHNSEGGNVAWYSPDGVKWEFDCYNENFRLFNYETLKNFTIYKDGSASFPESLKVAGNGYLSHMLTIPDSSNAFIFYLGAGPNTTYPMLKITQFSNTLQIIPKTDNTCTLGHSIYKFESVTATNVYNSSGVITSSDRNKKKDFAEISTEFAERIINGLKPTSFKYKDGTSGRTHYGMIAQDVEELLNELGIDSKDFAPLIKKYPTKEIENEDGSMSLETDYEGEPEYFLRYEGFIGLIIKYIQNLKLENTELSEKVSQMENRLDTLEKFSEKGSK